MIFEDDHGSRTIHLDGRPHLGPAFKEYEIREEACHEGSRTLMNIFGF